MKKTAAWLLVIAMILGLCACSAKQDTPAPATETTETTQNTTAEDTATEEAASEGEKHYKIGFSPMSAGDTFQKAVMDKCQELVEARGDTFYSTDPNMDGSLQVNQIEDLLSQKIDALIFTPVAADGILPALERCQEAGVPTFNYDGAATERELTKTLVATNNYSCGHEMGKYLLENVATSGKVIALTVSYIESMTARYNGFMDAIKDSDIELVTIDYDGDRVANIEDLIVANPDAVAFMGFNSVFAIVAYSLLDQYQRDIPILSIDGAPEEKECIRDGQIMATSAQSPYLIAETIVGAMYKDLAGESIETDYSLDPIVIDKNNVDQYGYDGWQ